MEHSFFKNLLESDIKNCLQNASDSEILSLVEVCYNLIKYRYKLSAKEIKSLQSFAHQIRNLSKTKSRKTAEKILISLPKIFYSRLLTPLLKNASNDRDS